MQEGVNKPSKGKVIMRISWTDTLRTLAVGQVIEADLIDRINIVRHISRISKLDNRKFSTRKISKNKVEIMRIL